AVLVRGATVLDVDGARASDLRVGTNGRITENGPSLTPASGEDVIECAHRLIVPGGVDVHTHLHLPVGSVRVSDDFDTGTRAAAIGGTTTPADHLTAHRGEDPPPAVANWQGRGAAAGIHQGPPPNSTRPRAPTTGGPGAR